MSTTNAVKATWTKGQIVPTEPVDWPEGSSLLVEPLLPPEEKIGLDESEWRDDAEAIADWVAWVDTIEPIILTDDERADLERYWEAHRKFNLEAVRKQMEAGGPS